MLADRLHRQLCFAVVRLRREQSSLPLVAPLIAIIALVNIAVATAMLISR